MPGLHKSICKFLFSGRSSVKEKTAMNGKQALSSKNLPDRINNVRIASPCPADWDKMIGDDRVRHCAECNLNVYNFSAMTTPDVERLLSGEGRLCARFYRRKDGTMLTQDCPHGFRAVVWRVSKLAGAALSAVMSVGYAAAQGSVEQMQQLVQIDQQTTGVSVRAVDPTGAVFPNAHVRLMTANGQAVTNGATDQHGELTLRSSSSGLYAIEVSAPGFETYKREVNVRANSIERIEVKLELVPSQGEVIIVDSAMIPTADSPVAPTEINLQPMLPVPAHPTQTSPFKRFFKKLFHV